MTSVNATNHIPDIDNMKGSLTERFFMGIWCAAISSVALTGNVTVLIASFKYNAIKLDKISTILIQNVAVADAGFSMYIIITLVTIVNDGWVFADILCHVTNYMCLFLGISEIYLICALNESKLHCLLFPLKARLRSIESGRLIAIIMWSVMPLFHLIPALVLGREVSFTHSYYRYEGSFRHGSNGAFPFLASICFVFMPLIVVFVAIIWLFNYVREGIQKQSLFTHLLISLCYFCSYLPFGIYQALRASVPGIENNTTISIYLYRFALFISFANTSVNPFIYICSVRSFKHFLISCCIGTRITTSPVKLTESRSSKKVSQLSMRPLTHPHLCKYVVIQVNTSSRL